MYLFAKSFKDDSKYIKASFVKSLQNTLKNIISYIVSFALVFNPIVISANVYAGDIPTQNNLNDGHIANLNSHLDTTAGAMTIDGTTNTGLDRAQNNVPIVNIATPSNAGVSKNNFIDFNVGNEGAIMNNSNQIATSKLGGAIYANPNLDPAKDEARIILNEVTSTNRSNLYGATEIHGRSAEYILANPNGITCQGCGFINAPRVGLITGTSRMANGDIEGFDISSYGDIKINGNNNNLQAGLNVWDTDPTNNIDSFDIVTRVAKINARIYAKDLNIKTGNSYYNYKTKEITSKLLLENKPIVAIDSSALGGMYAGRIIMESSESGVGVNLGANAIADTNALKITSEGDIVYAGIASNSSVNLASNEGSITQNSFIKAGDNLNITSKKQITLNGNCTDGNCVQSNKDTTISSNYNISSSGNVTINSGIINNTKIIAQNTNLNTDKTITNNGEIIASDSTNTNSGVININSGNLTNSSIGIINSQNNLNLNISTEVQNQGRIDSLKEIIVQAENLNNSGTISAKESNTIIVDSLTNVNGKILADQNNILTINNAYDITGTISSGEDLNITSNNNITNKTNLQTGGKTTMTSINGDFLNGYITNPTATSNMQSASVYDILSDTGIEISANNITNYGTIQTGGDLTLYAKENLKNITTLKTDGGSTLQANLAFLLSIGNTNLYGNNIINSAAEILSLGNLTLAKDSTLANATIVENISTKIGSQNTENNYISATIDSDNDITFNTLELNNKGYDYDLDASGFFGYNVNNLVYKGGYGNGYYNLMNQDQAYSTLKTRKSFITAGRNININNSNTTNYSSAISAGNDINIINGSFNNYHNNVTATNLRNRYGKHWTTKRKRKAGNLWRTKTYHHYHQYDSLYNQTTLSSEAPTLVAGGSINATNLEYLSNGVKQTGTIPNGAPKTLINKKQAIETELSSINMEKNTLEQELSDAKTEEQELLNASNPTPPSTIDKALIEKYITDETVSITELTTQAEDLNTQISTKQTEVNNETDPILKSQSQAELDALNGELNEVSEYITTANTQKSTLTTKLSEVNTYEENILLLETLKTAEDTLKNEKNTLGNINDQPSDTSNLTQTEIDDLNKQKSITETNISTYQANLTMAENNIANAGVIIDTTKTTEENINIVTTNKDTLINDTYTDYFTSKSNAENSNLEEELTAIKTRITELEDAIKKNDELTTITKNNLTSVENQISSVSGSANKTKSVNSAVITTSQNANIINSQNFFNISSLFEQAPESSNYLLETRTNYISTDTLRGSFYFLDRIGYNPDQDVKVVGDPYYEAKLIQKQIQEQTGKRYLETGIGSDIKQLEQLYDNSYNEIQRLSQNDINLTAGISLTKEQISNLQKDIVWLEKEQIVLPDGSIKEALVPKLYLANFDEDYLKNATISANNINITSNGDITNYGNIESYSDTVLNAKTNLLNELGIISSEGNISLIAENDITNKGGSINSKGNLNINAGNNFNNINQKETIGDTKYNTKTEDIITAEGKLSSGEDLIITSGNNINFIGTSAIAEGSMSLISKNQINILAETLTSNLDAVMSTGAKYSARKEQALTNTSSILQAGGDFISTSTSDTNIQGSSIVAQGNGDIKSLAGDINITNAVDSKMTHTIEKKKGAFSSRHDEVYDYKETAKESTLDFGGDLSIGAEVGSLLVQGSSVGTDGSLNIGNFEIAKDVNGNILTNEDGTYKTVSGGSVENATIKAAELKSEHSEIHKKSSFNISNLAKTIVQMVISDAIVPGSGLLSPAIDDRYSSNIKTKEISQSITTTIYNHNSNISADGNININAKNDVNIIGSNIMTENDINIKAGKNIKIESSIDKTYTEDILYKKNNDYRGLYVSTMAGTIGGFITGSIPGAIAGAGTGALNGIGLNGKNITATISTQEQNNKSLLLANNINLIGEEQVSLVSSDLVSKNNINIDTQKFIQEDRKDIKEETIIKETIKPNYLGVATKSFIDGAVAGWLVGDSGNDGFGMEKESTGGIASGQSNADYLAGKSQYLDKMNAFIDKISFGFAGAVSTPVNQLSNFGSSWLVDNTIGLENIDTSTNKSTLIINVDSSIIVGGRKSVNLAP
jgi:filamentous hemagglutinin